MTKKEVEARRGLSFIINLAPSRSISPMDPPSVANDSQEFTIRHHPGRLGGGEIGGSGVGGYEKP